MAEVHVSVARSGGVAGIRKHWDATGDESWLAAVDDCPWPDAPHSNGEPDSFVWRITVKGERSCEAVVPERDLTGPWAALVDRVRASADQARHNTQPPAP